MMKLYNWKVVNLLDELCDLLLTGAVLELELEDYLVNLIPDLQENRLDNLIECLLEAGIVFAPVEP